MSGLTPNKAAELLGVSTRTLLRWEDLGKIKPTRTAGGHRRYDINDLLGTKTDANLTVGYARVSSHDPFARPETPGNCIRSILCQARLGV